MILGAVCFAGAFIVLAVVTGTGRERIERHVRAALGDVDAQVRAFADEVDAWDSAQTALARRVR